jgi:hypothetical protein
MMMMIFFFLLLSQRRWKQRCGSSGKRSTPWT